MSLQNEFNRITHLFNEGVEKTEKQAGNWLGEGTKRANELSQRMRRQMDTGRQSAVSLEEALVRHMREQPGLYVIGAALLLGMLIARLVMEARRTPRAPLL